MFDKIGGSAGIGAVIDDGQVGTGFAGAVQEDDQWVLGGAGAVVVRQVDQCVAVEAARAGRGQVDHFFHGLGESG